MPYELNTFRFLAVEDLALFARKISPENAKGIHVICLILTTQDPEKCLSHLDVALIRHRLAHLKTLMVFLWFTQVAGDEVEDLIVNLFRGLGCSLTAPIVRVVDRRGGRLAELDVRILEGRRSWEKRVEES